jgi:dTDP-4-amino-4,6-dideoxygalactose transaminase
MGLKLLAGTEGGYCIFSDAVAAEKAYLYGKHPRGLKQDRVEVLNDAGLLDSLQLGWRPCMVGAALVRAALPFLDEENTARRRNAALLRKHIGSIPFLTMPEELPGAKGCYHLMSLIYDAGIAGVSREIYLERLNRLGAGGFVYIPTPIHRLHRLNPHDYTGPRVMWHEHLRRAGVDYRNTHCPHAEWRSKNSIEFVWNWTEINPHAMEQFAGALAAAVTSGNQ